MDGTHFDTLAKTLATTRLTRLQTLRGLAVGALAAAIGVTTPDDAAAGKKKCGQCEKRKCHRTNSGHKRCRCKNKPNGTLCTGGACTNGTCVTTVTPTPTPVPPGPPPPGFNCTTAGCVG